MERLTNRMNDGTAYVQSETGTEGVGHFTTQRRLPELIAKLAAYEDTGLTPEEINRAVELLEADREKGCEYCLKGEDLAYGLDSMQRTGRIYIDGNLLTTDLYSESMAVAVCCCPVCGRKLEGKP